MNSLISLGASTSFSAGILSALIPGLTVDVSFLEEPVMLLAFVLLGRSLEKKARKEASGVCSLSIYIIRIQNIQQVMSRNFSLSRAPSPTLRTRAIYPSYMPHEDLFFFTALIKIFNRSFYLQTICHP